VNNGGAASDHFKCKRDQLAKAMTDLQPRDAALRYLSLGWSVIPLRPKEKLPLVKWEIYQSKHPSIDQVENWFNEHPDANVGVVTGAISGLVVLDIDPAHGGDKSLIELEQRHDALPHTVESLTGGGGRHIYFRHPGGIIHNRVGLLPGIDLRGDGGLIVAPPSVHPSGRHYDWDVSHHPDDTQFAELPDWLLHLAQTDDAARGHPLRHWRNLVREGVAEGERNSSLASLVGHLLWHGIDRQVVLELMQCWNQVRCNPPLSNKEVTAVVDSINKLHVQAQARRFRR
jgi:hypothetical protein